MFARRRGQPSMNAARGAARACTRLTTNELPAMLHHRRCARRADRIAARTYRAAGARQCRRSAIAAVQASRGRPRYDSGGQDHFYLEGQVVARHSARKRRHARRYCSTQHPSERFNCTWWRTHAGACHASPGGGRSAGAWAGPSAARKRRPQSVALRRPRILAAKTGRARETARATATMTWRLTGKRHAFRVRL